MTFEKFLEKQAKVSVGDFYCLRSSRRFIFSLGRPSLEIAASEAQFLLEFFNSLDFFFGYFLLCQDKRK